MALSVSCICCALVSVSAGCCGYLCYPSAVVRLWPLWSNPVPLSLIRCTHVVPSFLRCCIICHMVLIALNVRRSCDSHWDLIACIISYLNSDLTLPLNRYHGPLWYFVRWGSPVLSFFPLDQTDWFFKLLDLYSSQRFCEQVRRVILPWDVTDRNFFVFDLFPYVMVTNIHMSDPRLLCWIRC